MRCPFISYAREDHATAARLYDDLARAGATPWLDTKNIRAGQEWRRSIREALTAATHVIALISNHSVNKRGYVQNELRDALEILRDLPPGQIFIIPVRLDESEPLHEQLRHIHRVELFRGYEEGLEQILDSLRATSKSSVTPIIEPTVDRVAASLAHELTNVLSAIRPFVDLIKRKPHEVDRVLASAEAILRAVDRGNAITKEVLSLSRPPEVRRQRLSVRDWLASIEPELRVRVADRVELEIRPIAADLVISADDNKLTQVMTNLVANALQAIEGAGTIVISAYRGGFNRGGGRSACIAVSDNGAGIPPEYIQRVFEPFFTTKSHGSGIGLPLSRRIVAAHGGSLDVESTVGKGTTVFVNLPLASMLAEASDHEGSASRSAG